MRKYFYILFSVLLGVVIGVIATVLLLNKAVIKVDESLRESERLYTDSVICRENSTRLSSLENTLNLYDSVIYFESEVPTEHKKSHYRDLLQLKVLSVKKQFDNYNEYQKERAEDLLKKSEEMLLKIEFYLE